MIVRNLSLILGILFFPLGNIFSQDVTFRINPAASVDCSNEQICYAIEAQSSTSNTELTDLNLRLLFDDNLFDYSIIRDQDPLYSLNIQNEILVTGSWAMDNLNFVGEVWYLAAGMSKIGSQGTILAVGPSDWTYIAEICVSTDDPIDQVVNACPIILFDELPNGDGIVGGSGVEAIVDMGNGGLPVENEYVVNLNYDTNSDTSPFGDLLITECIDPACDGVCVDSLFLFQTATQSEYAGVFIESTSNVPTNFNGEYIAGDKIQLLGGFEVELGASIYIGIGLCVPPSFEDDQPDNIQTDQSIQSVKEAVKVLDASSFSPKE